MLVNLTGGMGIAAEAPMRLGHEADLVAATHPALAASMHADSALLAGTSGRFDLAAAAADRAVAVLPGEASPTIRCQVRVLAGLSRTLKGDAAGARGLFDEAGAMLARVEALSPAIQSIVLGLQGRLCTGQERVLRAELTRLIAMARETDTFGLLPFLLTVSADLGYQDR